MSMATPKRPRRVRRWLAPLLFLLLPALAAVAPWAWQRWRSASGDPRPEPPLQLTGEARHDRQAILERAARRLLPPGRRIGFPDEFTAAQAALMGEIGVELLALDRTRGSQVVQQAIEMATCQSERASPAELRAPERSRTHALVRLARSLKDAEPALAEETLRRTYEWAQGNDHPAFRVYGLCLFAREAVDVAPTLARSALRKAHGNLDLLPADAPADLTAVVAATMAQVAGPDAARPLVERAARAVPAGRARPLVQARLAARLAKAAPMRTLELARQAANGIQIEPQRRAVATLLAATHPEIALETAAAIREPGERLTALLEMAAATEAAAPARAEALYRRALREARALPEEAGRARAVLAAATGLAAYDLTAARAAVDAHAGPVSPEELMRLGVRAAERQPEAAARWLARVRHGDAARSTSAGMSEEVLLTQVRLEPDPGRALAMAQQLRSSERQAAALLSVARRLADRRSGA